MSDHTPCHSFRKANDGKCYNCGFTLSDHQRLERIRDAAPDMYEALKDLLSGWRYIREQHGDLYGVGWDRAEDKAKAALAKAEEA